jgi:hypothetical protein
MNRSCRHLNHMFLVIVRLFHYRRIASRVNSSIDQLWPQFQVVEKLGRRSVFHHWRCSDFSPWWSVSVSQCLRSCKSRERDSSFTESINQSINH